MERLEDGSVKSAVLKACVEDGYSWGALFVINFDVQIGVAARYEQKQE